MSNNDILDALQWRYAVKEYDTEKKISPAQFERLCETLRLTPSSFGLQPYTFIVVDNAALRAQLRTAGYGQPQITDASHLVVFTIPKVIDNAFIDRFIQLTAKVRGTSIESLSDYTGMIKGTINAMTAEARKEWATRQAYIALGILLAAAAMEGIDASPMEGFEPARFDEILGLSQLGLESKVIAALGFRKEGDHSASLPKIRLPKEQLFVSLS